MGLDLAVFQAIQSLTGIGLIDELMVFTAEFLVAAVPLVLVYLWFQGKTGRRDSILGFGSAVLGLLISYGMGLLYSHQNPSAIFETIVAVKPENAFPSQHTAVIFSVAWPLFWRDRKNIGALILLAALGTGFSRVYIGEHWPVDILGSIVASVIGFGIVYLSEDYIQPVLEPLIEVAQRVEDRVFENLVFWSDN